MPALQLFGCSWILKITLVVLYFLKDPSLSPSTAVCIRSWELHLLYDSGSLPFDPHMPFTPETFPGMHVPLSILPENSDCLLGLQIYQSNDQHRQANSGFRPTMSETVQPALRRSSRSTQGQGGAIIQLERVGDIISLPRTRGVNPKFQSSAVQAETTDAPSVNPMAPAPKRPRKRKVGHIESVFIIPLNLWQVV